jgi:hypothetical protein
MVIQATKSGIRPMMTGSQDKDIASRYFKPIGKQDSSL